MTTEIYLSMPQFGVSVTEGIVSEWLKSEGDAVALDEPLVSVDFNGDKHSSSVDSELTNVVGDMVKVMSWYDNEMGYAQRLLDLAKFVAERL